MRDNTIKDIRSTEFFIGVILTVEIYSKYHPDKELLLNI